MVGAFALVGPTASGKSSAGTILAERLDAEVVSVDSMLVYRGMDVGTAKPGARERSRVPYHLIDVVDPSERFTVARYQALALDAAAAIRDRGHMPLLVGGTGLYFRAVVDRLTFPPEDLEVRSALEREAELVGAAPLHARLAAFDARAAARIEPENGRRTVRALEVAAITGAPFSRYGEAFERFDSGAVRVAGIRMPPEVLATRIQSRLTSMLGAGWLEEIRSLLDRGLGRWLTSSQAIGYAELAAHLEGTMTLEDAMARTAARTRALARRQMVWFRRDPRIRWFDVGSGGAVDRVDDIEAYLRTP